MNRYVWSKFKTLIKALDEEEKQNYLQDLESELMVAKTRKFMSPNTMNARIIRKKIRYLKDSIGES